MHVVLNNRHVKAVKEMGGLPVAVGKTEGLCVTVGRTEGLRVTLGKTQSQANRVTSNAVNSRLKPSFPASALFTLRTA